MSEASFASPTSEISTRYYVLDDIDYGWDDIVYDNSRANGDNDNHQHVQSTYVHEQDDFDEWDLCEFHEAFSNEADSDALPSFEGKKYKVTPGYKEGLRFGVHTRSFCNTEGKQKRMTPFLTSHGWRGKSTKKRPKFGHRSKYGHADYFKSA